MTKQELLSKNVVVLLVAIFILIVVFGVWMSINSSKVIGSFNTAKATESQEDSSTGVVSIEILPRENESEAIMEPMEGGG